jgi:hypothetical protein
VLVVTRRQLFLPEAAQLPPLAVALPAEELAVLLAVDAYFSMTCTWMPALESSYVADTVNAVYGSFAARCTQAPDSTSHPCNRCRGGGKVMRRHSQDHRPCERCEGSGVRLWNSCSTCGNTVTTTTLRLCGQLWTCELCRWVTP